MARKWTQLAVTVLLLVLVLSACGSEPVGPHVGKWGSSSGAVWELSEGGTVAVTNTPQPMSGTYELEGDTHIRLEFDSQEAMIATIEIAGDQMRIIGDTLGILEFIRFREPEGE